MTPRIQRIVPRPASKARVAGWIVDIFRASDTQYYFEPFCGSSAVYVKMFYEGLEPRLAILSDIDENLTNLYDCISHYPDRLRQDISVLDYSKDTWEWCKERYKGERDMFWRAAMFLFLSVCSYRSTPGKGFAGYNEERVSPYWTKLQHSDLLMRKAHILRNASICNLNVFDCLETELTCPYTLVYLDPPYIQANVDTTIFGEYQFTESDHESLLEMITSEWVRSKVAISGYRSVLYDKVLSEWTRHDKETNLQFTQVSTERGLTYKKRTECLWVNFQ